jgi:hypothetical protein
LSILAVLNREREIERERERERVCVCACVFVYVCMCVCVFERVKPLSSLRFCDGDSPVEQMVPQAPQPHRMASRILAQEGVVEVSKGC